MTDNRSSKKPIATGGMGIDILTSLVFFMTLMTVQLMAILYVQIVTLDYFTLLTVIPVIIAFVALRRARLSAGPMLFMHLAVGAVYLFSMSLAFKGDPNAAANLVFLGFSMAANILYSMIQRVRGTDGKVSTDSFLFAIIVQVILFFIFVIMHAKQYYNYLTFDAVVTVTLFFIARQFKVFDDKYYHNIHSATQPVNSIKRQNYMTMAFIVGGIVLAVVVLQFVPIDLVSSFILFIIRVILLGLSKILPFFFKALSYEDDATVSVEDNVKPEDSDQEPSTALVILTTVILIIMLLLLLYFLISLIRLFLKYFRNAKDVERTVENDAVIDIIENVDSKRKRRSSRAPDFGTGLEREIRRKYYRRVRKAMAKGLPIRNSSSPRQIEAIIKKEGDPSISELTSQYEAIRYNQNKD